MSSPNVLLLRGGSVLVHEGSQVRCLENCDVLVEGNRVKKIAENINLPPTAKLIDCTNKIVSPGFIDTHHHLWQSQLKGRHGDQSFMDYMVSGNIQSYNYQPQDVFWGQLVGCLQSLDAGVTTVVDHAHMTYSSEHVTQALRATSSSGLRSVYCYTPILRIKQWSSSKLEFSRDLIPTWFTSQLQHLAASQPFANGRVSLGLGFDLFNLPKQVVVEIWEKSRNLGLKLITTHYAAGFMPNIIELISNYGLLQNDVLISHANGIAEKDAKLLVESNVFISSTPDTELQMGLGEPVGFRPDIKSHASIGVDCHANNSSDVLTQLRLGLQHARGRDNEIAARNGAYPGISVKLEEAFNLGTIQGAKAINMEKDIGSLAEGKLADIVVFDATTPAMVCAAEENPIAAILLHASVRDIDFVLVDGIVRKEYGKLCDIGCLEGLDGGSTKVKSWLEVVNEVRSSAQTIKERGKHQDLMRAKEAMLEIYS